MTSGTRPVFRFPAPSPPDWGGTWAGEDVLLGQVVSLEGPLTGPPPGTDAEHARPPDAAAPVSRRPLRSPPDTCQVVATPRPRDGGRLPGKEPAVVLVAVAPAVAAEPGAEVARRVLGDIPHTAAPVGGAVPEVQRGRPVGAHERLVAASVSAPCPGPGRPGPGDAPRRAPPQGPTGAAAAAPVPVPPALP